MSTNNIFQNLNKKDKKNAIISITIVTLLVAIVVGIASFNIGKNQNDQSNSPIPVVDVTNISKIGQVLGQQLYNWTGNITEIQKNYLVIQSNNKDVNGNLVSKKIIANINEGTNITEWDLRDAPNNPLDQKSTSLNYSDLRVGHEVIVKSNSDLDNNNEVTATDINLLITP